jgi:hypothetical protein
MTNTDYDLDEFVNNSKNNVDFRKYEDDASTIDMFERLPAMFAAKFKWDTLNESADPVLVWELNGQPVAWYDCEMFVGYIKA